MTGMSGRDDVTNIYTRRKCNTIDVEYIYHFVSLGGLQAKSMTSERGTLQDGR